MVKMKKKNLFIISTGIFVLLISILIAYFVAQYQILYHFAVVDEGKLYRSGTLSETGLKWAHAKTNFKTIINLRSEKENMEDWYRQELEFAQKNGVKLVDFPMERGCTPSSEQVEAFIDIVSNADNLPVIIHHQGVTRTAIMVAIYEMVIKKNKNKSAILKNMPLFGRTYDSKGGKIIKDFILDFQPDLLDGNHSVPKNL